MIDVSIIDNLLVYKDGYSPESVAKIIKDKKLAGLRIFSILKSDQVESLDFLKDYTFLTTLSITSMRDYDFGFLKALSKLTNFSINVKGTNEIDFSSQAELKDLSLNWRKNAKGLDKCVNLQVFG